MRIAAYKHFQIKALALIEVRGRSWIPCAQIRWTKGILTQTINIKGTAGIYRSQRAAEAVAMRLGEIWVDGYG